MTAAAPTHAARQTLARAATVWFVAAALGQAAFITFIVAFYLPPLFGDPLAMNAKPHITAYVPGDTLGNAQFLVHVFIGGLVTLAGVLQVVPSLRKKWPAFHRWNGRLFMVTALVASAGGFWLTWVRGSQLNLPSSISTSLNGVLIALFVVLAWRSALARDFATHRRHALRAWLLVNGVWFLRIGIVPAGMVGSALGLPMSDDGPLFLGVSYLSWIAPLALLQLYFAAERSPRAGFTRAVAALLGGLAFVTLGGSVAAILFMWWPYL